MQAYLPPLRALQAFEVAGRLLSFSKAATELSVTPGAVSRQIRLLEDELGFRLFQRLHREVLLTSEGREYLQFVRQGFEMLKVATRDAVDTRKAKPLHIWCSQTFAMRWLMPRLPSFHNRYPEHDITLTTTLKPVDFVTTDADLAVRLGNGKWPHTISHLLTRMELTPVCSPDVQRRLGKRASISALKDHTLLHSLARPDDWRGWLNSVAGNTVDASRGMFFDNSMLTYQAAIEGMGLAMAQKLLVQDELSKGLLVTPFDSSWIDKRAFYLIYPERVTPSPALRNFRKWILAESKTGR